jgi:hypothetical protein
MTRVIWVIIAVLVVGIVFLFLVRIARSGSSAGARLTEISRAHGELAARFPDSRFRIQLSRPRPEVRNLVVTIQPGRADSARLVEMVESTISVLRSRVELTGYDSLLVAVFDSVWRSEPARP